VEEVTVALNQTTRANWDCIGLGFLKSPGANPGLFVAIELFCWLNLGVSTAEFDIGNAPPD